MGINLDFKLSNDYIDNYTKQRLGDLKMRKSIL